MPNRFFLNDKKSSSFSKISYAAKRLPSFYLQIQLFLNVSDISANLQFLGFFERISLSSLAYCSAAPPFIVQYSIGLH